jgi:TonB family protein
MRVSVAGILGCLGASCVFWGALLSAQTAFVTTVEALQRALQGKVLSLRTPVTGEKLVFDAVGIAVGQAEHGVFSLDRDIAIDSVREKDGTLLLKGSRINYVWSSKYKQLAQTQQRFPVEVQLKAPQEGLTEANIGEVLRKVFLTPKEMNAPCTEGEREYFQKLMESGDFGRSKSKKKDKTSLNQEPDANEPAELTSVCMPSGERGFRVEKGVKPPKAVATPDPKYSESARRAKIQGTAVYIVRVDENGRVTDVLLQRSLEATLNLTGARAISQWRFEPATFQAKPLPIIISVEVNFRLY